MEWVTRSLDILKNIKQMDFYPELTLYPRISRQQACCKFLEPPKPLLLKGMMDGVTDLKFWTIPPLFLTLLMACLVGITNIWSTLALFGRVQVPLWSQIFPPKIAGPFWHFWKFLLKVSWCILGRAVWFQLFLLYSAGEVLFKVIRYL